jgi:DNA-binding transcriptional LysR family regulator
LEEQLGVALLYRSTRKLSLTRDGERLIASARIMVSAAEEGIGAVVNKSSEPSGELHVTAPAVLAHSMLAKHIAGYTVAHPKVRLTLDFSEVPRDIIGEGIDVAIRMGRLRDSSLKARKLHDVRRRLMAARSYLDARPVPASPKDVEEWDWLELAPVPPQQVFRKGLKQRLSIKPVSRICANNAFAVYQMARNGAGLTVMPEFLAEGDVAAGIMDYVCPDWEPEKIDVYAIWPHNATRSGLTASFVKFLAGQSRLV